MHSISLSVARAMRVGRDALTRPFKLTIALAVVSICQPAPLRAAVTLADFGYQNMKVNGVLATGPNPRPLVVILVNFAGYPQITSPPSFFADLIFNTARFPSVNGYLQAVSNNRFSYANAGVIGPLSLSAAETERNWAGDTLYCSNIIYKAMVSSPASFGNNDANHDGHVTRDELEILIISQDNLWGGRYVGAVKPAGFAFDCGGANGGLVSVVSSPAQLTQNGSLIPFAIFVEEIEEMLGIIDIYGYEVGFCLSPGLSPQSCNYSLTDIYYLDAFNRLEMGWCEPRIRSLTAGGIETIPAAQTGTADAPIILYDPARGTSEFFILEYRTRTSPVGSGYDVNVANNGLAVWHIKLDASHNAALVPNLDGSNIEPAVWNEGPPVFQRGTSTLWGSDATSPTLRWLNGDTLTHLHVRPFSTGDGAITVEWLSAENTWADFSYPGNPSLPESGAFNAPYNTLAEGVSAVSYGGILNFKTGFSAETRTVSKPMTFNAYNGPVTIGR